MSLFVLVFIPRDTFCFSSAPKFVFFLIMNHYIMEELVYCCKLCLIDSSKANAYSLELGNFFMHLFKR